MKLASIPAVAAFLFLLAPAATAEDASQGVILPGLRSATAPAAKVTVKSAHLELRGSNVEVVLNISSSVSTSLTLETPEFRWLGDAETYPDRQFPELQITIAGSPTAVESTPAAFVGKTNVTEALRDSGLDPFLITDTPPLVRLNPAMTGKLEALGAIRKSDGEYLANWTAQRTIQFPIPAGGTSIKMTYHGRPAFELESIQQIKDLAKYCTSSDALSKKLNHPKPDQVFVVSEYSIPVSIDNHPPRSLTIKLDEKTATASCGSRTDSTGVVHILSVAEPGARR